MSVGYIILSQIWKLDTGLVHPNNLKENCYQLTFTDVTTQLRPQPSQAADEDTNFSDLLTPRLPFLRPTIQAVNEDSKLSDVEEYCDESAEVIIDMRLKPVGKKSMIALYNNPEKVTSCVTSKHLKDSE